jgi:hypothetical protein
LLIAAGLRLTGVSKTPIPQLVLEAVAISSCDLPAALARQRDECDASADARMPGKVVPGPRNRARGVPSERPPWIRRQPTFSFGRNGSINAMAREAGRNRALGKVTRWEQSSFQTWQWDWDLSSDRSYPIAWHTRGNIARD